MPSGGSGDVGPDEIARDDVVVGSRAVDVDPSLLLPAITFRSPTSSTLLPSVPIRLPEAGGDRHTAAEDVPRESVTGCVPLFDATDPEMSVPIKLPATALPSCPAR